MWELPLPPPSVYDEEIELVASPAKHRSDCGRSLLAESNGLCALPRLTISRSLFPCPTMPSFPVELARPGSLAG